MLGHCGRNQEPYGGEKKQPSLEPRGDTVEFLKMKPQAAKKEGRAQHKQRIRHDRASNRCLHQGVLSRLQSSDGDDELG